MKYTIEDHRADQKSLKSYADNFWVKERRFFFFLVVVKQGDWIGKKINIEEIIVLIKK